MRIKLVIIFGSIISKILDFFPIFFMIGYANKARRRRKIQNIYPSYSRFTYYSLAGAITMVIYPLW